MKARKFEQHRTPKRQQDILDAALDCFVRLGYDRTTIQDIRKVSKASVGSIYHHFGDKEGVYKALYLEGILQYQTSMVHSLTPHTGAYEGIKAIIRFHLEWVQSQPHMARFLFESRNRFFMKDAEQDMGKLNDQWHKTMGQWLERHQQSGAFRPMSRIETMVVLLGPCQEMTRLWLEGIAGPDITQYATGLARSVWAALSGTGEMDEGSQ